jgi:hypothetical protein
VEYIQQLKDSEASNIEKWTLEKLLSDQTLNEYRDHLIALEEENDSLRQDIDRLLRESERGGAAREIGVSIMNEEREGKRVRLDND